MTNAEQKQHWLKFHRFQQRYEGIYTTKFNQAIKSQIKEFISTGTLMSVNSVPVYKVLRDLYFTIPAIWAARATREARNLKERMPMGFSQRIIDLMKTYYGIDLLNLADDLTQTTKDTIQTVLSQAAEEGFGFDEVVRRLQIPELTTKRARLIARTETVGAANAASNIAAKETGLIMDKIWISARDNRTRPHHRQVNQSIVGMDETFTVGVAQMQFPGDKAGGAAEVCNCRCTHAFIPRRDANGRLIRIGSTFTIPINPVIVRPVDIQPVIRPNIIPPRITEPQKDALEAYTGSNYGAINTPLRKGRMPQNEYYNEVVDTLTDFLDKAPKTPGISYRGLKFNKKEFDLFSDQLTEGVHITDKGFMSTSLSEETARVTDSIYEAFIEIEGKSGVALKEYGLFHAGENEILFNRNIPFKIISVEKNNYAVFLKIKEL